jgi:hypothetical protein
MNTKQRSSWVIGAAVVIGCLILALFLSPPSAAVPSGRPAAPEAGRYQFLNNARDFYLLDTATGQTWYMERQQAGQGQPVRRVWVKYIEPLAPRK